MLSNAEKYWAILSNRNARWLKGLLVIKEAEKALLKIEESVDEVKTVASKLSETMDKINGEVLAAENIKRFEGTLENLEKSSASFVKLGEKLDPAIGDFNLAINEVRETNQTAQFHKILNDAKNECSSQ